jgi:hypothetical protein
MDLVPLEKHCLTRAQFEQLADVPPVLAPKKDPPALPGPNE